MKYDALQHTARVGTFGLLTLVLLCLVSCSRNRKDIVPSADFAPYVNAYTGGVLSQGSAVRIELACDLPMVDTDSPLENNPFRFSPSLEGTARWTDNHTIEFLPDEGSLQPGTFYEATFRLGDFMEVEKRLRNFRFSFRVQERCFSFRPKPVCITADNPDEASVSGELRFNDVVEKEEVERMVKVSGGTRGGSLPFTVVPTRDPLRYELRVDHLPRKAEDYYLYLTLNGKSVGISGKQTEQICIPAKGTFRFLSARRIDEPESIIEIVFSDPVDGTEELTGLIEVEEFPVSILQLHENRVWLYWEENRHDKLTLRLDGGIKSCRGEALGTPHTLSFSEQNLKPQVELAMPAAILPDAAHLVIPFRAVSLRAVDLSVIRIFDRNVLTFLQNNSLSGMNELRRCGRLVYKQTLRLDQDAAKNLHRWENYSVDLGRLIREEPGAIYRVILSFRQEYSVYPCGGAGQQGSVSPLLTRINALPEESEWDSPYPYYYYGGEEETDWSLYDWKERDNPCHPSYYMGTGRSASCNVYASRLGMQVKRSTSGKLWAAVNSLTDTKPVAGAKVTVYNYQLQPLEEGKTDRDGLWETKIKGKPFLVAAEADGQKAYVRVVDGEEQSVSRFDVGGKERQKGLKGFLYGERGVWRPGDTLHVSFILEDRERKIPDTHPVSLELYTPGGQFCTKQISTQGLNGFHTFAIPTPADAPTGVWNAYVKVGGSTFHKRLRIESIKPNRLKINLTLPKRLYSSDRQLSLPLSSAWLTGATASRLKTKVELSLSKVETPFPAFRQYSFNNPATDFTTFRKEIFDGALDETGRTNLPLEMPKALQAPGVLNATFTVRVFEPGGDASSYIQSAPFSPFDAYVGINLTSSQGRFLETDTDHAFEVVTVDAEGKLADNRDLEFRIYRIGWSWWWEEERESLGTYLNNRSVTPVAEGKLRTAGGKARLPFRIDYPAWGRYLVYVKDTQSGHATGGTVCVDWPEWRGRSDKQDPDGIKMLTFSLDKEEYEIGETVTALLPASAGGRALVSIENGATVLRREWVEMPRGKDVRYTFEATPDMAPNVYLHVCLLQPHDQTVNDLPIRLYGVMPVLVNNRQTRLQPQIRMADVLKPETDFSVTVSEKSGRPMTYTLAIVDDGLLDLTNFQTPDPWSEFYSREALGIRTWDMYDDVLGAAAGRLHPLFSTGGDAALKPAEAKANRFRPVVKFIGPFHIGKGKQRSHTLRLPMYVGSVRVMVVAGEEGAYGHAEKTVAVRMPLMLLSSLPRVLSIREEVDVPVNVFAMDRSVREVSVSLQAKGGGVRLVGPERQTLRFDRPGDQLVYFRLKTSTRTGKVVLRLTAEGDGKQAKETVEIEVRNPNPVTTLRESRWVEAGQTVTLPYGIPGGSAGGRVRMEVSRIPSVDLSRRTDFLLNYPHSCTEQLTSKGLSLLFLPQFREMSKEETLTVRESVQEAIQRIYTRQLPDGSFVCWPGESVADEWVTSYAGMFLTWAREKGYAVQEEVSSRWQRFQRTAARNWQMPKETNHHSAQAALQQAFRLYTLALAGAPEQGAVNRMVASSQQLPLQARWRLAAACAVIGQQRRAEELTFRADRTVAPYSAANMTYGSSDRDEAMILETLLWMERREEALQQAKRVSENLSKADCFDTQSTAFSLLAMGRLVEQLSGTLDFTWLRDGKPQTAVRSAKAIWETDLPASKAGSVTLQNKGAGVLEVITTARVQLQKDTLPAVASRIRLEVAYTGADGRPMDVRSLKQGTEFTATVTVTHRGGGGDCTRLALVHILPSGWEVSGERHNASCTSQDVRDDRLLTYFDLKEGETKTFSVLLRAAYVGRYHLPAVQCEAMYDSAVRARSRAGFTEVCR